VTEIREILSRVRRSLKSMQDGVTDEAFDA